MRGVALVGTALVALLIGVSNFLSRVVYDGVYGVPFGFIGPLKYGEVVKNFTDTGMGVASANPLSMSQELWDSLTDEQRAVIDEVTICARLPIPTRIGPTSSPFALALRTLRTALAASVEAKTNTFAGP